MDSLGEICKFESKKVVQGGYRTLGDTGGMGVMGMFPCALTCCLEQRLFDASVGRPSWKILILEKTLMAFFSPLASGKPKISHLAAVRSGRSPSRSDAEL